LKSVFDLVRGFTRKRSKWTEIAPSTWTINTTIGSRGMQ
jgi:hypothetical protein